MAAAGKPTFGHTFDRVLGAPAVNATIFFMFVIIGCAYIILAKFWGLAAQYVTFVPVGIMCAYALLILSARALRLRDDQSGDNLYYMGFLYTLTSLGVSLYQFRPDRDDAAAQIVQNFGIAISSTIAGIALRVLLNQMRRDPLEVERVARIELAEAARRVRRELDSTVVEFSFFRRATQQSLMEGFEDLRKHVDEVAKKLLTGLEDLTEKSAAPLESAGKTSGQTIETVTRTIVNALEGSARELAKQTDNLAKGAAEVSSSLDGVSAKLGEMQTPDRVIEIRLQPTIESLAGAVRDFTAVTEAHSDRNTEILERTRVATENSLEALAALRREAASNERLATETAEFARQTAAAVRATVEALKSETEAQGRLVGGQLSQIETALHRLSELLHRVGASQTEASASIREVLPMLERNVLLLEAAGRQESASSHQTDSVDPIRETAP